MITTRDLQQAHGLVQTARIAVPFDQAAYDAAYNAYLELVQAWAQEGQTTANEARQALVNDPALRRMFGEGK
jgi:hypothetical protein